MPATPPSLRRTLSAVALRRAGPALLAAVCVGLAGCASGPAADGAGDAPAATAYDASAWARLSGIQGADATAGWMHKTFGDRKPTQYQIGLQAGRPAVYAHSAGGNSTLRRVVTLPPGQAPDRLRFSWWVPQLNAEADLRDRDIDDAVARVILSFDGDRAARFSVRDHMLSELAQLITGEPLPYATLMYVWDNRYPVGTVIPNPHSDRIRQLVVESGPARLGQWVDFERDVQADFQHAFGEAPGPLHSLGLMSDTNNTGATVDAWYGPINLTAVPASTLAHNARAVGGAAGEAAEKDRQP